MRGALIGGTPLPGGGGKLVGGNVLLLNELDLKFPGRGPRLKVLAACGGPRMGPPAPDMTGGGRKPGRTQVRLPVLVCS